MNNVNLVSRKGKLNWNSVEKYRYQRNRRKKDDSSY